MNANNDEGKLISGKEALIALANGEKVEYLDTEFDNNRYWREVGDIPLSSFFDGTSFRLAPRTITINGIEVPAPFEPKEGEIYFYLNPHADAGYGSNTTIKWNKYLQFGAWRTEEEIKQVVAALRQVLGGAV